MAQLTPFEPPVHARHPIRGRRIPTGSLIGRIAETQEVRDFCAETGMRCGTEMIRMDAVYAAQARRGRGNVRDRLVIDMQGLRDQTAA